MKTLALASAAALAFGLAACSTTQTQQFAHNVASDAAAIGTMNAALIQLNGTIIASQTQLASALAQTYCPVINASVSLGAVVKADASVAKNVQAFLTKAGATGALASDICAAAGLGSTTAAN